MRKAWLDIWNRSVPHAHRDLSNRSNRASSSPSSTPSSPPVSRIVDTFEKIAFHGTDARRFATVFDRLRRLFSLSLSLPRIIASLVRNFSLRDGELSVRQFGIHRGDPYKGERSWRESRNDLQQADARIRLSRFRKGEMARSVFSYASRARSTRRHTTTTMDICRPISLSLSLDRKRNKAATVVVVLRRYNAAVSPSDICHFT